MKYLLLTFLFLFSSITQAFDFSYTASATAQNITTNQTSGYFIADDSPKMILNVGGIIRPTQNTEIMFCADNVDAIVNYLTASYTHTFTRDTTVKVSLGTNDEFYSFFQKIPDPDSDGMIVKPQGVYNDNFLRGGFAKTNGIRVESTILGEYFNTNFGFSYGVPYIENEDALERAVFSNEDEILDVALDNAYSLFIRTEWGNDVEFLYTRSSTKARAYTNSSMSLYEMVKHYEGKDPNYLLLIDPKYRVNINRVGIAYAPTHNLRLTAEQYFLDVENDTLDIPGSTGYYIMGNYFINSNYSVVLGHTQAQEDGSPYKSQDTFVALAYDKKEWTLILEYHSLKGKTWVNGVEDYNNVRKNWHVIGTSLTYRFN